MKKLLVMFVALVILIPLVLAGCTQSATASKLTEADLANLEYKIEVTPSGVAKLQHGGYSEEAAPGSASKIEVRLTENIAYGELNSNDAEDAAVILWANGGGSGSFAAKTFFCVVINFILHFKKKFFRIIISGTYFTRIEKIPGNTISKVFYT